MSEQWTWKPIEHGFILRRADGVSLALFDNVLGEPPKLWVSSYNFREMVELPDDLRLCRRVPAQGVPAEHIQRLVTTLYSLIHWTTDGDREAMNRVQSWLDAQAQGQEGDA